ncbi:protein kinase [bacterium]|nr:protein kinase [candidate division CSSED10-310 bacterium]
MNKGLSPNQYRIIIADSDMTSLKSEAATLRAAGYSIVTTPGSNRILRMAQKTNPDLIILSTDLKGMSGIETCRALIEKLNFSRAILMISDDCSEQMIMKAYEAGASEYLIRPCPPGLLRAKVKLLLQNPSEVPGDAGGEGDLIRDTAVHNELELPVYRIIDKIGAGAMGEVYKAMHKITFDTVAIKVVHASRVKSVRDIQRFFRGSLIGLELPRHPNLVQIIEIKKSKDFIYQIMEYVDGLTLQQIIKKEHRLTERETVTVLRDITLALDVLHQHQVLHRDVKPGNIFITQDWQCKLGDLGISRRLIDRTATTTGHVVGTPGYISPEQVLDIRPLDIRTDIYSLGLTLYHAVTGMNPFSMDTPYESMLARLQGEEAVLTHQNADTLSESLREIINRMIRRRAVERFATPLMILSELEKRGLFQTQEKTNPHPLKDTP